MNWFSTARRSLVARLPLLLLLSAACSSPKTLLTTFVSPISIASVSVTPPLVPPGGLTTIAVVCTATTGSSVHYHWTTPADWTVTGPTDGNTLTLTAPHVFGATGTVALTADDGQGRSISTTIAVATTTDLAPTVTIATTPATPHVGVPIVVTSQVSASAAQQVTYAWSLAQAPEGSLATLSQTDGPVSGLTADVAGAYVVQLIVTDEQGLASLPATAVVSVAYAAPVIVSATATPTPAAPGGMLTLRAVATSVDGYPPQYTWTLPADWTQVEPATGDTIAVVAPSDFGVSALAVVTVDDGHGQNSSASIPLSTSLDAAPVVSVTTNPTNPEVGSQVELTAEVSATGNRAVSYSWILRQSPNGSVASMLGGGDAVSKFTPDVPGTYVVRLVVTDEAGLSTTTSVTVTVHGFLPPNITGVVASPASVPPGGLIVVSASATSPDGYGLTYAWTLPTGWTASGPTDSPSLILTAPLQFASAGLVTVSVGEGHRAVATSSVVVRTTDDQAPTVSITAAPLQPVVGASVLLTSQASASAGQTVSYAWSLTGRPSGSSAALADPTEATTNFVPDVAGDYALQLVVTDAAGLSSVPASVTVSASGFSAPTISSLLATPATVEPGGTVLVTSQVATTDGYPVHYSWTVPSGWTTQGAADGSSLLLTAPQRFGAVAQLLLKADEGHGASSSQLVILRTTADTAPTVTIHASPTNPLVGSPVSLTSRASTVGAQTVTYAWSLAAVPAGSAATLTNATAETAGFMPDLAGTYVASLVVTDASGLSSAPATTTITVAGFTAPLITGITATPQTVAPGGLIAVSAAVTSTDGFDTTYAWSVPSGWTIVGPADADSIVVSAPTTYGASAQISLVVNDSHGATASSATLVGTTPDSPPSVAIATTPTNPVIGATVSLTSQATALGGQTLTYVWSLLARPSGSTAALTSATTPNTTLVPDIPGAYTVQLVATDASGVSNTATAVVSVGGYTAPTIQSLTAAPPTAPPGGAVTLVAVVVSTDGFPLHYAWTLPTGWTAATATDGNSIGLVAPAKFGESALVLLTVDEGHGRSASSSVIVATTEDAAPTVSITSTPSNPVISTNVNLSAHASVTGGQAVTYAWSLTSRPTGSVATIPAASSATTAFTPDLAGTYIVSVVVTDASGLSSLPATTTISVSGFLAPVIQSLVATPPSVTPGGIVSINAGVTSADGYPVHYVWGIPTGWIAQSATTGSSLVLQSPALYGQAVSVLLTVDDGHGMSASSSVLVKTTDDVAPTVTITTNPSNPFAGTPVTMVGHATTTGGQVATYAWTLLSTPTGSLAALATTTGDTGTFTPDVGGSYLAQVVATDASGLSSLPTLATIPVGVFSAPDIASLTVAPVPVTPGGLVTVTADVQSTDAFPINYVWTIPAGWTPLGPVDGSVLILTAPATFGTQDQILLTVDDGQGVSATSSAVLETSEDVPPQVTLTVSPSNPTIGTVVNIQSQVVVTANQAVTYAWSMISAPLNSTATLTNLVTSGTSLTPDLPGDYVVQLVVTDAAGTASAPALATVKANFPGPIAVIAGPPPLKGVMNAAIKLDGSGSSNPVGNAISFTWSFLGIPPASHCTGGCFSQGTGLGLENLTPDAAGLYSIQLTVKDVVTGLSATATTTVKVDGPAQIIIVSGNNQTALVKTGVTSSAVVKVVAADGVTPIPNLALTWTPANATVSPGATVTDSNGSIDALVVLGRVAGTAHVTVSVTNAPTISAVLNFAATAQLAASRALLATIGSTDGAVPLTVSVVDVFGNPTTNAASDILNSSVTLVLESPFRTAQFGATASRGSISQTANNPPRATVVLSNGVFVGSLTDTVAEPVIVSVVPGPDGANTPMAAWTTQMQDHADTPGKNGTYNNPALPFFLWSNEPASSGSGMVWRLNFSTGVQATQLEADLFSLSGFTQISSAPITLLNFTSSVQSATTFDTVGNCYAQPAFRVRLSLSSVSPTSPTLLVPTDGYEMFSQCGVGATPFFGPTNQTVTEVVDITDKMNLANANPPPVNYVDFMADSHPDANLPPPTQAATWRVGEISVRALSATTYTGAQSNAVVTGGVPVALNLATSGATPTTCGTTAAPTYTAMMQLLDANGNISTGGGEGEIHWSGATGLVSVINSPGEVTAVYPDGVKLQGTGKVLLQVTDSAADTLTFTLSSSRFAVINSTVTVTPPSWRCHTTGNSFTWADTTPLATYNATQAINACQAANFNLGLTCALGPNYAYPVGAKDPCNALVWVYSPITTVATSCAPSVTIPAGKTATAKPFSQATSACACGPLGESVNVGLTQGSTWQ